MTGRLGRLEVGNNQYIRHCSILSADSRGGGRAQPQPRVHCVSHQHWPGGGRGRMQCPGVVRRGAGGREMCSARRPCCYWLSTAGLAWHSWSVRTGDTTGHCRTQPVTHQPSNSTSPDIFRASGPPWCGAVNIVTSRVTVCLSDVTVWHGHNYNTIISPISRHHHSQSPCPLSASCVSCLPSWAQTVPAYLPV